MGIETGCQSGFKFTKYKYPAKYLLIRIQNFQGSPDLLCS